LLLQRKKIKTNAHHTFNSYEQLEGINFLLSLGGDGTFLESVTYSRNKEIPILGINTGRLGFLAATPKQKMKEDIAQLLQGKYSIEDRSLIKLETDNSLFNGLNFALNEFSILKKDSSSMIVVHTFIDDVFLNSYWADGLIVATPTGSTAYALSCGGPVVLPSSSNFVIAPISPHNLNVRPLIVSDTSKLSFKIEGRSKNFLVCLDSRSKTVSADVNLTLKKEDFKAKIVRIENYNFLNTLREKLNWGLDQRN
jgi:NAD+ kinase